MPEASNYLAFIDEFVNRGYLDKNDYGWLKKDLLYSFLTQWMIDMEIRPDELMKNIIDPQLTQLILQEYKDEEYYDKYLVYYRNKKIKAIIKYRLKNIYKKLVNNEE